MTKQELEILIKGLNEHMRTYCSFETSEENDVLEKGWFDENDILNCGIVIQEPIDYDKLHELATDFAEHNWDTVCSYNGLKMGFKNGYIKAKTE